MKVFSRLVAVIILIFATAYLYGGSLLLSVGGSWYYALAGLALLLVSVQLWRQKSSATTLYSILILLTMLWAVWEVGFDLWALLPRLNVLLVIGLFFLLPPLRRALHEHNKTPTLFSRPLSWLMLVALFGISVGVTVQYHSIDIAPRSPVVAGTDVNTQTNWPSYGNRGASTRYSPLAEITPETIDKLEVAWSYRTGVGGVSKATPIQVGELLYICGGGNVVIALDAEDGRLRWQYDPKVDPTQLETARYFTTTCRGVSYFKAPEDYQGQCPERILTATTDARLIAVDAISGELCTDFGSDGMVDLSKNMGADPPIFYFVTSPPAIVKGNAVVGGWVLDNRQVKEPSGVVRAFDALSGEFSWAWDMGRPGYYGEPPEGEVYTRGTPNVWSLFSVDEERGWVYAPTGNETPDYFGAQRLEASEQFASSVVALDGETGAVQWSFQTVHHDIWDYDVPSQPVLVDVPDENGRIIPGLIQATKRGEIFYLNRVTGEPIAEVKELPVPQGGVPEDWTAKTQPFSVGMPHFRDDLTEQKMWGVSPFDHMWCRIEFRKTRYDGPFTPPRTDLMLQFPGTSGGFNWGSVSVDEKNHLLIAAPMIMANRMRLIPRDEMTPGAGSPQLGTPYGATTQRFMSPLNVPCFQPPYGLLAVIDLKTQKLIWQRPIGNAKTSGPWGWQSGLPLTVGTPIGAGTLVTAGGLIFIGSTVDSTLHAVDINSGEEVWQYDLPQTGQATPMSYLSPTSQQQTLVMTLPVYGRSSAVGPSTLPSAKEDPEGGYVIAFRLNSASE